MLHFFFNEGFPKRELRENCEGTKRELREKAKRAERAKRELEDYCLKVLARMMKIESYREV